MLKKSRNFLIGGLLAVCFGLIAACTQPTTNTNLVQTTPTATPATAQTTIADGDWPGYNRTLTSERFSPSITNLRSEGGPKRCQIRSPENV